MLRYPYLDNVNPFPPMKWKFLEEVLITKPRSWQFGQLIGFQMFFVETVTKIGLGSLSLLIISVARSNI